MGEVVSKVELSFSCTKLRDLDVLSKSDPMCVVYSKLGGAREWNKVGRTEMVKDNLNPKVSAHLMSRNVDHTNFRQCLHI